MNTWWVNHKQTVSQEVGGGYLWSPKKAKDGKHSQFYENMRKARPGDVVFSYANREIRHYGIVTAWPFSESKPKEFGPAGDSWDETGWMVLVSWYQLKTPFRPKNYIHRIRPLLPEKYSPIRQTGDGNQGAYLCEIDRSLLRELMKLGNVDIRTVEATAAEIDEARVVEEGDNRIDATENRIQAQIEADTTLDQTEIQALVKARKGQGIFRYNVERIEPRCRVTGLEDKRLLIASHVKPWRRCETNQERLDGANGLLLAPHIDRLFDRGLITFERDGHMFVSTTVDNKTLECLGLPDPRTLNVGTFSDRQEVYLAYHRNKLFLP